MSVDSVLDMQYTALIPVAAVVLLMIVVIGGIAVSYLVSSLAKAMASVALLAMVCLAVGWVTITHEHDRVSQAREEVMNGFDQTYGLKLDDSDLAALKRVEEKDVTRDLESTGGDLKHVLLRVIDGDALPHTLDGAGTWIPMPAHQNTR